MSILTRRQALALGAGACAAAADSGPGARNASMMMAWDETSRRTLLFANGLWSWDGRMWAHAGGGPVERNASVLVWDARRRRAVLYGGRDSGARILSDTWEWDGRAWRESRVTPPGPRLHGAAAFDRKREVVVLCGPMFGATSMPRPLPIECWTWDGAQWTQVSSEGLSDCLPVGMAWDESRKAVALVTTQLAREGSSESWGETRMHEWNGKRWTASARRPPQVAPNDGSLVGTADGLLIFDGATGTTWISRRTDWAQADVRAELRRTSQGVSYDRRRRRVVLFGGAELGDGRVARRLGDTWEFDGRSWTQAHPG